MKSIKNRSNLSITYLSLFMTSVFILLQSPLAPGSNGVPGVDSGVFLYCASQIIDGKLMYTEIFDHKGPFLYVIDVIGILISNGKGFWGVWLLELISLFTSSVLMFKTLRLQYNLLVSALSVISGLLFLVPLLIGGNLTEEWAILPISLALYLFGRYSFRKTGFTLLELFLLALSFTMTFLLKSNMTVIWVVFGIIIFITLLIEKDYKKIVIYFSLILLGILISLVPFILYGYFAGNIEDAIDCYLVYNSKFFVSWNASVIYYTMKTLLGFNYLSIIISVYLCLLFVQIIFEKTWLKNKKDFIYQIGILLSFFFSAFFCAIGNRHEHYYMMFAPLVVFAFGFWFNLFWENINLIKGTILLFLVFLALNAKSIHNQSKLIIASFDRNIVTGLSAPSRNTLNDICDLVNNESVFGDEILVRGNLCSVYLLCDRNCSSRYPYRTIFDQEMENEYRAYIRSAKPKLILSGELVNDWYKNDELDDLVRELYILKPTDVEGLQLWVLKPEGLL